MTEQGRDELIEELCGALEQLIQKAGWAMHYGMVEGEQQYHLLGMALLQARRSLTYAEKSITDGYAGNRIEPGEAA